jgi:hypothetical protein
MCGKLWMELHERCEYMIDLALKLILIIMLISNLVKNQRRWTFGLDVAYTYEIDDTKISIKCIQN